jgi:hypothetical protein
MVVDLGGIPCRVSGIEEETLAYIRRGQLERAALCMPHCDHQQLNRMLDDERVRHGQRERP